VKQIPSDPPGNTFAPSCGIPTDETYVGDWFGRGAIANPKGYKNDGEVTDFHDEGVPVDGRVTLSGQWITQQDGVTSAGEHDEAQLRYHARSVYAVLSVANPKKPLRVYLRRTRKLWIQAMQVLISISTPQVLICKSAVRGCTTW
jgi:Thioredoxin like C-terminal domain